jgi:hypothetical protein
MAKSVPVTGGAGFLETRATFLPHSNFLIGFAQKIIRLSKGRP